MKSISNLDEVRLTRRSDPEFERVVFAEVLIPEVANVAGDYWTKEGIKEAAYAFMRSGYIIDVDHDNVDRSGDIYVIESFIARAGDPDFIEGAWVVAMKIEDDAIWQDVLDGTINGYSYEAIVSFLSATLRIEDDGVRSGYTEPDVFDGHVHAFVVMVDEDNRPISGGTDAANGHTHSITVHTVTDITDGHRHRYNLVTGKDGK